MCDTDLAAALECGVKRINLSIPVSDLQIQRKLGRDRAWVLATIAEKCTSPVSTALKSRWGRGFFTR